MKSPEFAKLWYPEETVIVLAQLHLLDLINSNPDYRWQYIYYRKVRDAKRTHNTNA